MNQFPILRTERLSLEKVRIADIPNVVTYAGHELVAATTLAMPHPYQEKDAIWWINFANEGFQNKNRYLFGIRLKETDAFMGGIGLHLNLHHNSAELGYWIAVPFWNKGYMTEALGAILKFGFDTLQLNKIHAVHFEENLSSGKVMIKNGMIQEGILKDHVKKGKTYKTAIQYRLTKAEYQLI